MIEVTSSYNRTDDKKYCFTLYLPDNEKYTSDFYNLIDIKKIKQDLISKKSTFDIYICDENNNLEEVNI